MLTSNNSVSTFKCMQWPEVFFRMDTRFFFFRSALSHSRSNAARKKCRPPLRMCTLWYNTDISVISSLFFSLLSYYIIYNIYIYILVELYLTRWPINLCVQSNCARYFQKTIDESRLSSHLSPLPPPALVSTSSVQREAERDIRITEKNIIRVEHRIRSNLCIFATIRLDSIGKNLERERYSYRRKEIRDVWRIK